MAAPITWQNVTGPSLAQAAIPMESAAKLILDGFDRAGKTLTGYNTQQQAIEDRGADAQVQSFLERLQRVRSPEEVAALQASGELDTLRAGLRPQDLAKVRGAEDARISSLMQQTTAKNTFDDALAKRAADPIFEQFRLAGLNGDEATQAKLLAENPSLRGWAGEVERDKALERKLLEQKRADELAPLTHKNDIAAAKEVQRAQAEKESTRRLEATLADALAQRTAAETPKLGAFPKVVGYSPAQPGVTPPAPTSVEEAEALNESILQGGTGITGPRVSDTVVADNFVRKLRESKEFPPEFIEKNLASIRSSFDSTARGGRVGNDAASAALDRAKERVMFDEKMKNNWSAPGTADVKNSYEALAKELPSLIDKTSGTSIEEDLPYLQEKLQELAINGIEIQPGEFVTPSINEVRAALRIAQGGNGWLLQGDKHRGDEFMRLLQKNMKGSNVAARIKEAGSLQQTARKFAVQEILNSKK